jgi:mono/diheme cytochrome c family protein
MVRWGIRGRWAAMALVALLSVSVAAPSYADDAQKGDAKSKTQTKGREKAKDKDQDGDDAAGLARLARGVFKQNCIRCHHGKGSEGGNADFLNRADLVTRELIKPGDVGNSYVLQRIVEGEMPPPGETPRPSVEEVGSLWRWIEGEAPEFPKDDKPRPPIPLSAVLTAARDHLRDPRSEPSDKPFIRFFTLHNLANNRAVSEDDLRIARAALSKAINSLSRKPRIVVPVAIDPTRTVFAVNIDELGWDYRQWTSVEREYPYGLRYDSHPNADLRRLDQEIRRDTGALLPLIRADWFIATATRPPLYHVLLRLPDDARVLERELGVDIAADFLHPRLERIARAGFPRSGVSGQNRLVERHEIAATDGAGASYWKSNDYKPTNGRSNLTRFPLGPLNLFPEGRHPFPDQAYVHDGGEIIFGLPNGLQAYLLVNGKDNRIDTGPIDVVSDALKTSGTAEIVTGVSCMACHKHGLIALEDTIRKNNAVFDDAKDLVERLYPEKTAMDRLLEQDTNRFLAALEKAIGPFLREGTDKDKPIQEFPEPIGEVARAYRLGYLDLNAVAAELDVDDSREIIRQVGTTPLKRLGLDGLLEKGGVVSRADWEAINGHSLMQELARELRYTPVRPAGRPIR